MNLNKFLRDKHSEYVLSKQVIRSRTSIGANIQEAYDAVSPADFINKFSIAQKECAETSYYLRLLHATDYLDEKMFNSVHTENQELYRLIMSRLITKKKLR